MNLGWWNKSILFKITAIAGLAAITVAGAGGFSAFNAFSTTNQFEQINLETQKVRHILADISVDFQKQLLYWNKLLLRGNDSGQREKYWEEFEEEAADVQKELN